MSSAELWWVNGVLYENCNARSFTWKTMEKHALYSDIAWTGP